MPIQPISAARRGPPTSGADWQSGAVAAEPPRQGTVEPRVGGEAAGLPSAAESSPVNASLVQPPARIAIERDDSGRMVVRLTDPSTGDVIRQIPPEEMLKIAESIDQYLGLLVDRQS